MEYKRYIYNGPVMQFNKCVKEKWQASTVATSSKKAKNNLAYRFKLQNNLTAGAKISLPGKISIVE